MHLSINTNVVLFTNETNVEAAYIGLRIQVRFDSPLCTLLLFRLLWSSTGSWVGQNRRQNACTHTNHITVVPVLLAAGSHTIEQNGYIGRIFRAFGNFYFRHKVVAMIQVYMCQCVCLCDVREWEYVTVHQLYEASQTTVHTLCQRTCAMHLRIIHFLLIHIHARTYEFANKSQIEILYLKCQRCYSSLGVFRFRCKKIFISFETLVLLLLRFLSFIIIILCAIIIIGNVITL